MTLAFLPSAEVFAIFLPLLGFLVAGLGGYRLGKHGAELIATAFMLAAAAISIHLYLLYTSATDLLTIIPLLKWMAVGPLHVTWSLRFDVLTAVMLVVVNVVSAMVHVYSLGYMAHDPYRPRFFAYLSFFTFAMLMLVTSDNLVQLFFGWEGVGLASYLLINFWFKKPSANDASIKAFLVNRVGDFGFALGILGIFFTLGSVNFANILMPHVETTKTFMLFGYHVDALTVSCLLLFMGAMGKSAQIGLHTWLPDAMEGPTPVSALIHAATMVTAGVFMLCRLSPLFEAAPQVLEFVAIVGALTAVIAATIGMTQWDIKRVIAYSTMSQLGYMFFAIGISAYGAAMFHLMTHAFFKSLLFLGAGSVIHALSGEQDLRKMGGIWRKVPITTLLIWIGSLALAGIPFFAGYYSKDIILESTWAAHSSVGEFAWAAGMIAALMTAFYSWRLIFLTFNGPSRADVHALEHAHESPPSMMIPMLILSVGAMLSGWYAYDQFVGEAHHEFWGSALHLRAGVEDPLTAAHHVADWVKFGPTVLAVIGILLAWIAYLKAPAFPQMMARIFSPLYALFYHKWYFDELYNRALVKPALTLGRVFWKFGDGVLIDGCGPDGMTALTAYLSRRVRQMHTGYVYHYAFVMVIGMVGLLLWIGLKG